MPAWRACGLEQYRIIRRPISVTHETKKDQQNLICIRHGIYTAGIYHIASFYALTPNIAFFY